MILDGIRVIDVGRFIAGRMIAAMHSLAEIDDFHRRKLV